MTLVEQGDVAVGNGIFDLLEKVSGSRKTSCMNTSTPLACSASIALGEPSP